MTEDRKTPNQQNQTNPIQPRRGEVEDPLKVGMKAAGGQVLRGSGMSASAQQSGRGLGESSIARNWDAGGLPGQDERGTISTGPDTAPEERARQQDEHEAREREQQQAENLAGARSDQQQQAGIGKLPTAQSRHAQPSLDETTPPDVLARNPDVTRR